MDKLSKYLTSLLPENDDWVNEIELQAKEEYIPIMEPVAMNFLMQIIRMVKPKEILEVGTAIGYSTLRMNEAFPSAKITTIERDERRVHEAIEHIQSRDQTNIINVLHGDGIEHMDQLLNDQKQFDVIFIDAAKSSYKQFFKQSIPLLSKYGIIITDNVLFKGYVFDDHQANPRHQRLAEKINAFNQWLAKHPDFITSFVPIGDGVALSVRKE